MVLHNINILYHEILVSTYYTYTNKIICYMEIVKVNTILFEISLLTKIFTNALNLYKCYLLRYDNRGDISRYTAGR